MNTATNSCLNAMGFPPMSWTEGSLGPSAQAAAPTPRPQIKRKTLDGLMD